MVRDLKQTIERLRKSENDRDKNGYSGDATEKAFRRHVLILLKKLISSIDDMWIMFDNLRDELKKKDEVNGEK